MNKLIEGGEKIPFSIFVTVQFVQRHCLRRLNWMVLIAGWISPSGSLANISAQRALSSAHYYSRPPCSLCHAYKSIHTACLLSWLHPSPRLRVNWGVIFWSFVFFTLCIRIDLLIWKSLSFNLISCSLVSYLKICINSWLVSMSPVLSFLFTCHVSY